MNARRKILSSRKSKVALGVAVLALVAVVGGPYVYIHFIKEKAPAPLSFDSLDTVTAGTEASATDTAAVSADSGITADTNAAMETGAATDTGAGTETTAAGPADSGDLSGTWTVAQPSTAGYRAKEILFGQSTEGVGRTTDVTGTITIAGDSITEGTITVDLTTLKSDEDRRDGQVQGRILQTSDFPRATFTIRGPLALPAAPAIDATVTLDAPGTLNLHGIDKEITIPLQVKRTTGGFEVIGSSDIVFTDYGISDPSNPAAQVENHATLELALTFAKG
jgi:polyisoprenoid-binding protein YceI